MTNNHTYSARNKVGKRLLIFSTFSYLKIKSESLLNLARGFFLPFAMLFFTTPCFAMQLRLEPFLGWTLLGRLYGSQMAEALGGVAPTFNSLALGIRSPLKIGKLFFVGPEFEYLPDLHYSHYAAQHEGVTLPRRVYSNYAYKLSIIAGVAPESMPMRVWLGYGLVDNMRVTFSDQDFSQDLSRSNLWEFSGQAVKLGGSYLLFTKLNFTMEYSHIFFNSLGVHDKLTDRNGTARIAFDHSKKFTKINQADTSLVTFSIGAPFDVAQW
jgi:hypothetical protein